MWLRQCAPEKGLICLQSTYPLRNLVQWPKSQPKTPQEIAQWSQHINHNMGQHELFIETFRKHGPSGGIGLQAVLDRFTTKTFQKKTFILKEGGICREFFFINEGMVRTFVNHDGDEITTWVALPGTIETSAQSFIRQIPSAINLQAITDCEVLCMTREDYYYLLHHHRPFNSFAVKLLENFYLRVEDKFYSYLFLSAEERFIKMKTQYPEHFTRVPLKYLASILRIKPETLSRLRKKMK